MPMPNRQSMHHPGARQGFAQPGFDSPTPIACAVQPSPWMAAPPVKISARPPPRIAPRPHPPPRILYPQRPTIQAQYRPPTKENKPEKFEEEHISLLRPIVSPQYTEKTMSAIIEAIKPNAVDNKTGEDLPAYDTVPTTSDTERFNEMSDSALSAKQEIDQNMLHFGVLGPLFLSLPHVSATIDSEIALDEREIEKYEGSDKKAVIEALVAEYSSVDTNESALWLDFVREHIFGTMTLDEIE